MLPDHMKAGDLISGKYRLIQRLGVGAMGAVWEAINQRTGKRVALKLILHPTDDLRVRLLREARACGSLEHRNIIEIYDVGETESGDPFLVMQLLSGETLAGMLSRKRRIEPAFAARIGRDIASALAVAHEAKIIHRDLKPANIFLHREGNVGESEFVLKVLDFGVSKNLASADGPATVTGMVIGSPAYMSPEQIRMIKDVDCRSDLWSLGVILFELLTGVRLFRGTAQQMMAQVAVAPIPPVSSRVRHVPPELDAIVARCLERDRGARFQDAKEIERLLSAYADVSQMSRTTVNGSTPPASDAGRTALVSAPDLTFALTPKQSATGSSPDVADSMDQAPTLIFPRRAALPEPGPRRSAAETRAEEKVPAAAAPMVTQLLSPMDPIPSPTPAWRLEIQRALAASRQTSATTSDALSEDLPQGGTLALSPQVMEQAETAAGHDAKRTAVAPLTQLPSEGENAEASMGDGMTQSHFRRGRSWLYAVIAVGVVTLAVPVMVFGIGVSSPEKTSRPAELSTAPERVTVQKEAPVSAPVIPMSPAPTAAPSIKPSASKSAAAAPSVAPTSERSSQVRARETSPANPRKPGQPSSFDAPIAKPKCGKFIKTDCQK
jgi:eukaryotic-like serine/threonine-protein kinase